MSIAGIRSNRGDSYQTLVALDWALIVLSNPEFEWLENDSILYSVDDIVIGKTDGTIICCQCKKNQKDFKSWLISDLSDELVKALNSLIKNKNTEIRFYSRSPFGALHKLREYCITQPDEKNYQLNLSKEQKNIDLDLLALFSNHEPTLSTYEFLCRTTFETSPELDRMEEILRERLHNIVSNPDAAYNALWKTLDKLGGRMSSEGISTLVRHRLTKKDFETILQKAGAVLTPYMDVVEVRSTFTHISAIGRSWQRDIAGQRIPNPVLNELIKAIDNKQRTILLTGLPGSGKTCVMLSLQEELEKRAQTRKDVIPLFIQSREFADFTSVKDREAQGLPEKWVKKAARMADEIQVVVVIDSLDVLSIAREHSILTYFLSQIDCLSMIPNITVVTACRDFDRNYDRRIAQRKWDCELKCLPLNWTTEIAPLLESLGIDPSPIDTDTRELIRNPRELALFVELAQRNGCFNVVNSQALAQRYLDEVIKAESSLGDMAMHAIENMANEMLMYRKLVLPQQQFEAPQKIQRLLCSLNVLRETQDRGLTFGHQTLLDVLVISRAVRKGLSLNKFIESLPPVPFVRPSVRSFVLQLSIGNRREFRKQIRTVLTGTAAFHIRRLVAEILAEQVPQDNDWPLIRDLRKQHHDVFQVIYTQAKRIEWHYFWMNNLVPMLKVMRDENGLITHVHRVSQWKLDDVCGVLTFWKETLELDWMNEEKIGYRISSDLSKIGSEHSELVVPLIIKLLDLPRQEHSFLGRAIVKCVIAGVIEDTWLWRYIANDIRKKDIRAYRLHKKLRCGSQEFGDRNNNFLLQRMTESTSLLDLALHSIENWSRVISSRFGNTHNSYCYNFLHSTSYERKHSQNNIHHIDSLNILFDAVEAAILNHAKTHSDWWQANRERLCFNNEGALRYFALLACIANPLANVEIIGCMLKDKNILESDFSFEFGTLIKKSFIYLDPSTQDAVMACILSLWQDEFKDKRNTNWALRKCSELIIAIPCHLRSFEIQAILDSYEEINGKMILHPHIMSRGGIVQAPFSFEVFHQASDVNIIRLLAHYSGYQSDFDDFLIGGEREVGNQLSEASSRHPLRFLNLLSTNWVYIAEKFRDYIMNGVARYLALCYGNLQNNDKWEPVDKPDGETLVNLVLDELERNSIYWYQNRAASEAIKGCAHVIKDTQAAERLVFLSIGFSCIQEESPIRIGPDNLITAGINMISGRVVEGLMNLTITLQEQNISYPQLLIPTLHRYANNNNSAIRALILRYLPYLQSKDSELGWDLFHLAMQDATDLWKIAEPCLYWAYHNHFEKVAPILARIKHEGCANDMETWGRISALAVLSNHIDMSHFLNNLIDMENTDAWRGAASVWTHPENIKKHRELCLSGIETGLKVDPQHAAAVAKKISQLFQASNPVYIPTKLVRLCFNVFESDNESKPDLFGLDEWLNIISHHEPEQALAIAEIYLDYIQRTKMYLDDYKNNFTQLMTLLFAEAEEREESDRGEMLQRVVSLQDTLLLLGVDSINHWLKAAERP